MLPAGEAPGYSKPGYVFPPGHVLSEKLNLAEIQQRPQMGDIKLWLVANAPIAIPF